MSWARKCRGGPRAWRAPSADHVGGFGAWVAVAKGDEPELFGLLLDAWADKRLAG